jgi:hypothetical protein
MTSVSVEKFEGSWKNGKREGVGFAVNPNGDWFEGVWRADKRNGPGLTFYCTQVLQVLPSVTLKKALVVC